eukprot:4231415-Pleurochrysis_carterae.AAC.1
MQTTESSVMKLDRRYVEGKYKLEKKRTLQSGRRYKLGSREALRLECGVRLFVLGRLLDVVETKRHHAVGTELRPRDHEGEAACRVPRARARAR